MKRAISTHAVALTVGLAAGGFGGQEARRQLSPVLDGRAAYDLPATPEQLKCLDSLAEGIGLPRWETVSAAREPDGHGGWRGHIDVGARNGARGSAGYSDAVDACMATFAGAALPGSSWVATDCAREPFGAGFRGHCIVLVDGSVHEIDKPCGWLPR